MKRRKFNIGICIVAALFYLLTACSSVHYENMGTEEERGQSEVSTESGSGAGEAGETSEESLAESAADGTEEETEAIDPAVWEASLDRAVTEAIWEEAYSSQSINPEEHPEYYYGESHRILDIRDLNGQSIAEGAGYEQGVVVYAVVAIISCEPSPEEIGYRGYVKYVAEMTFSPEDEETSRQGQAAEPCWALEEFWREEPYPQGEEAKAKIAERFPADLVDIAYLVCVSQIYMDTFMSDVYEQAIRDTGIDGDSIVENMFDIMFYDATDEDIANYGTYLYINKRWYQYTRLFWYGDYTLRYVCSELIKGERTELELRVLAEEYMQYLVFYFDDFPLSFSNPDMVPPDTEITRAEGRDYFLEYLAVAQELADAHGMEWMQKNEPYKWKVLVMVQEIRQELEREAEHGAEQEL